MQIGPKCPWNRFFCQKGDESFFTGTLLEPIWEARKRPECEKKPSRNRLISECRSEGARSSILAPMGLPGPPNETRNRPFLNHNPRKYWSWDCVFLWLVSLSILDRFFCLVPCCAFFVVFEKYAPEYGFYNIFCVSGLCWEALFSCCSPQLCIWIFSTIWIRISSKIGKKLMKTAFWSRIGIRKQSSGYFCALLSILDRFGDCGYSGQRWYASC